MVLIDIISDIRFLISFILFSIAIGMLIFKLSLNQSWIDSFYNSSMILSTIGTNDPIIYPSSRILVGLFSLYSGIVFIVLISAFINFIITSDVQNKEENNIKKLLEEIKSRFDKKL